MYGPLHIEIAALRLLGDWFDQSGWTNAQVQDNIASDGISDAYVNASHMGRTRWVHGVTICALYELLDMAYDPCIQELSSNDQPMINDNWLRIDVAKAHSSPVGINL